MSKCRKDFGTFFGIEWACSCHFTHPAYIGIVSRIRQHDYKPEHEFQAERRAHGFREGKGIMYSAVGHR
jgi:hypothetical protein